MFFYIGHYQFTVAHLFWLVAAVAVWQFGDAFFRSEFSGNAFKRRLFLLLLLACGGLAAKAYGLLVDVPLPWNSTYGYGSLGLLAGMMGAAVIAGGRHAALRWVLLYKTVVLGFAGLLIARVGCVIGGCCRGSLSTESGLVQVLSLSWPLLDMIGLSGALMVAFVTKTSAAQVRSLLMLGSYLVWRILIEYLRPSADFGVNPAQALSLLILLLIGASVSVAQRRRRGIESHAGAKPR